MSATFNHLPPELHLNISHYLTVSSFHSLQLTNRRLYNNYHFSHNPFYFDALGRDVDYFKGRNNRPIINTDGHVDEENHEDSVSNEHLSAEQLYGHLTLLEHQDRVAFINSWHTSTSATTEQLENNHNNIRYRFHLKLLRQAILLFDVTAQPGSKDEKKALATLDLRISSFPPRPTTLYTDEVIFWIPLYKPLGATQSIPCTRALLSIPHFHLRLRSKCDPLHAACRSSNVSYINFLLSETSASIKDCGQNYSRKHSFAAEVSSSLIAATLTIPPTFTHNSPHPVAWPTSTSCPPTAFYSALNDLITRTSTILTLLSSPTFGIHFDFLGHTSPLVSLLSSQTFLTPSILHQVPSLRLKNKLIWRYIHALLPVLLNLGARTNPLSQDSKSACILNWALTRTVRDAAHPKERAYALPVIMTLIDEGGLWMERTKLKERDYERDLGWMFECTYCTPQIDPTPTPIRRRPPQPPAPTSSLHCPILDQVESRWGLAYWTAITLAGAAAKKRYQAMFSTETPHNTFYSMMTKNGGPEDWVQWKRIDQVEVREKLQLLWQVGW